MKNFISSIFSIPITLLNKSKKTICYARIVSGRILWLMVSIYSELKFYHRNVIYKLISSNILKKVFESKKNKVYFSIFTGLHFSWFSLTLFILSSVFIVIYKHIYIKSITDHIHWVFYLTIKKILSIYFWKRFFI